MPEYRRFISYFYEYIDGKKQKNAGFAKVELRNGMWRILLRITAEVCPRSPIQVYGFVREPDRLQGILLGEIRPVQQIAEEWAFRADAPIGGKYGMGDLSGLWVESSDMRRFITVWDDEEIDMEHFVAMPEQPVTSEQLGESEQMVVPEQPVTSEQLGESEQMVVPEQSVASEQLDESEQMVVPEQPVASEQLDESEMADQGRADQVEAAGVDDQEAGEQTADCPEASAVIKDLLRKRTPFQPFSDTEMKHCVMIQPCDIVRLQQENWNVGRSSFLQHGFYQYRHLLLGLLDDGTYILGVPGIRSPQETYMAQMFGYDQFRECTRRDCSQTFGYWCRRLQQI